MAIIDRRGITVDGETPGNGGSPSAGVAVKAAVRAVATSAITLAGLQTVNGVALAASDRVLVTAQADTTTNGIYTAGTGDWVRAGDAESSEMFMRGMRIVVLEGAPYDGSVWELTSADPIVLGTTELAFSVLKKDLRVSAVQGDGYVLHNDTGIVARLFGGAAGNDGGRLDLRLAAVTKTLIAADAASYINSGYGLAIGKTTVGAGVALDVVGAAAFSGNVTTSAAVLAGASGGYYLGANLAMVAISGYHVLRPSDSSTNAIQIGNNSDPRNLYNRTSHVFRSSDEATTYGTFDASGLAALALIPSGSTVPSNGIYLPAANTIGWATNTTARGRIDSAGNFILGVGALATNATNGFVYIPSSAGTPTGTPTAVTGMVPIEIDTTGSKVWAYFGGGWKSATLT